MRQPDFPYDQREFTLPQALLIEVFLLSLWDGLLLRHLNAFSLPFRLHSYAAIFPSLQSVAVQSSCIFKEQFSVDLRAQNAVMKRVCFHTKENMLTLGIHVEEYNLTILLLYFAFLLNLLKIVIAI